MANSLEYDGNDLAGASYGVTVARGPLVWIPEPVVDVQQVAKGPAASHFQNFAPRAMPINAVVVGSSHSDLQTKLDNLVTLLDPALGERTLRLDQIAGRYWLARLANAMDVEHLGPAGAQIALRFLATDPRGWDDTESDQTETINADPFDFTVPGSGNAGGTTHADPVWLVRNSTGGNVSSVAVDNQTTSETMTWNGTLEDGRWLAIATGWRTSPAFGIQNIYKSTAGGADPLALSYSEVISGHQTGSKFPRVKHGVSNSIRITGVSSGTVRVLYRPRYL